MKTKIKVPVLLLDDQAVETFQLVGRGNAHSCSRPIAGRRRESRRCGVITAHCRKLAHWIHAGPQWAEPTQLLLVDKESRQGRSRRHARDRQCVGQSVSQSVRPSLATFACVGEFV